MKIVFKLTVDSGQKDAVAAAIATLAAKHAERLERGRNARHPFNDNQAVKAFKAARDEMVNAFR